jgi:hypothetical protein
MAARAEHCVLHVHDVVVLEVVQPGVVHGPPQQHGRQQVEHCMPLRHEHPDIVDFLPACVVEKALPSLVPAGSVHSGHNILVFY